MIFKKYCGKTGGRITPVRDIAERMNEKYN